MPQFDDIDEMPNRQTWPFRARTPRKEIAEESLAREIGRKVQSVKSGSELLVKRSENLIGVITPYSQIMIQSRLSRDWAAIYAANSN